MCRRFFLGGLLRWHESSQQFCDAQQWAHTHFGTVQLGDVRRRRRVCTLVAGWAHQPGAARKISFFFADQKSASLSASAFAVRFG